MADGSKAEKPEDKYKNIDVKIERVGDKIMLPATPPPGMTYDEAIAALQRIKKDEEEEFNVSEVISGYHYLDGAVAFWKAIVKKYGFASPVPKPGFFGPEPPRMLTVKTGPGNKDSIQVPWGQMIVPGIENRIETGVDEQDGMYVFRVRGTIKRKNVYLLKELVELAREIITAESIYRGKAVSISDGKEEPKFIDTMKQAEEELILNRQIAALVEVNLMTPIKQTDLCLRHGIPIKRGVLLEGHYGTGKSLTGAAVARVAVRNGWTYILLEDVHHLEIALKIARHYAPAVVFAEDIDRVLSERDDAGNELINTIDGVIAKDMRVITVLTTNFADKLDRAMLRPGRLDAVIHYAPPDAESVQKLILLYARGLIAKGESLDKIGKTLAGEIPATIREVVERSKLAMISRAAETISEEDLLTAAFGMKQHLELLKSEKVDKREDAVGRFAEALIELVSEGAGRSSLEELKDEHDEHVRDAAKERVQFAQMEENGDQKRHMEAGKKMDGIAENVKIIRQAVGR